jgi:hypothetical protein
MSMATVFSAPVLSIALVQQQSVVMAPTPTRKADGAHAPGMVAYAPGCEQLDTDRDCNRAMAALTGLILTFVATL